MNAKNANVALNVMLEILSDESFKECEMSCDYLSCQFQELKDEINLLSENEFVAKLNKAIVGLTMIPTNTPNLNLISNVAMACAFLLEEGFKNEI